MPRIGTDEFTWGSFALKGPVLYATPPMNPKQRAAEAALEFVSDGMVVGLGTGSTADYFLVALSQAIKSGGLKNIRGVPTSVQSEKRARELSIPLVTLAQCPVVDVTIDGADEVTPKLDLIKGLGGALLREKIVAQNSKKLVIIADESKTVRVLGLRSPLPVEVTPFAYEAQAAFLRTLGAEPLLRSDTSGKVFVTDNGNYIYDCRFEQIDDPVAVEARLKARAGVVETGLFLNLATTALIGESSGISRLQR